MNQNRQTEGGKKLWIFNTNHTQRVKYQIYSNWYQDGPNKYQGGFQGSHTETKSIQYTVYSIPTVKYMYWILSDLFQVGSEAANTEQKNLRMPSGSLHQRHCPSSICISRLQRKCDQLEFQHRKTRSSSHTLSFSPQIAHLFHQTKLKVIGRTKKTARTFSLEIERVWLSVFGLILPLPTAKVNAGMPGVLPPSLVVWSMCFDQPLWDPEVATQATSNLDSVPAQSPSNSSHSGWWWFSLRLSCLPFSDKQPQGTQPPVAWWLSTIIWCNLII